MYSVDMVQMRANKIIVTIYQGPFRGKEGHDKNTVRFVR